MAENEHQLLIASDLDYEPILWKGLTFSEFKKYILISVLVNTAIGVVVGLLTGFMLIIFLFLLIGTMLSMTMIANYLNKAKPGKPEGYHSQLLSVFLNKKLGIKLSFIRVTCHWRSLRGNKYGR